MSDHSGFFSLYFDLFDLAAIFGYKFSETLRKSKNDKVYADFFDVALSHILFGVNFGFDSSTHLSLSLDWNGGYDDMFKVRAFCIRLLNHIDDSNKDATDLARVVFNNEIIFQQLLSITDSVVSEGLVEECELHELDEYCFDGSFVFNNLYGSNLYGCITSTTIDMMYQMLVEHKLTYDPTKLNPLTGTYGFQTQWFSYQCDKMLPSIIKIAALSGKKLDFNHCNDFGFPVSYQYWGEQSFDLLHSYAAAIGQILDLRINTICQDSLADDGFCQFSLNYKNNEQFLQKKAQLLRWSVTAHYSGDELISELNNNYNLSAAMFKASIMGNVLLPISAQQVSKQYLLMQLNDPEQYNETLDFLTLIDKRKDCELNLHNIIPAPQKPEDNLEDRDRDENSNGDYGDEQEVGPEDFMTAEEKKNRVAVLIYISVRRNYLILPSFHSVCSDLKCKKCEYTREYHQLFLKEEAIKERLCNDPDDIKLASEVLSDLAIRVAAIGDKFKAYVNFAGKNRISLNLYCLYEGKTMIERALLGDGLSIKLLARYVEEMKFTIDLSFRNQFQDRILDTIIDSKDNLPLLYAIITKQPLLFKFCDETDQYEILRALGRYEEALKPFFNNDSAAAQYFIAKVLYDQKKYNNTIEICDILICQNHQFGPAYYTKALALKDQRKFDDALDCLDSAISLDKDNIIYCINKAKILIDKGDKIGAENAIDDISVMDSSSKTLTPEQKDIILQISQLSQEMLKANDIIPTQETIKKAAIISKVIEAFNHGIVTATRIQMFKDEIADIRQELMQIKENQVDIQHTLDTAGVSLKADIKRSFAELKLTPALYDYNKAFYWTLLNYFSAYRMLSTGLIKGDIDSTTTNKESLIIAGCQKAATFVAGLAQGIPVIGSIVSALDGVIGSLYETVKEKRFNDRVNIICKIIAGDAKIELEEEISLYIAKASIEITKAKKEEIMNPDMHQEGKLAMAVNFVQSKIAAIKAKLLGPEIEIFQTNAATLALQDVVLLLGYLYMHHDDIIQDTNSLDVKLKNAGTVGMLESLQMIQITQEKQKQGLKNNETLGMIQLEPGTVTEVLSVKQSTDSCCCRVF